MKYGWHDYFPSGHPVVCAHGGCGKPPVKDGELCRGHAAEQRKRRAEAKDTWHIGGRANISALLDELVGVCSARREPWRALAACRGQVTVMYPERPLDKPGRPTGKPPDYRPALKLCTTCPVVEQCWEAGRTESFGVWGQTEPPTRGHPRRVVVPLPPSVFDR